ncbi:MAG: YggS family pyridoxal phosphate enzyme [Acidimicrobiales bacterium]
MSTLVEQIVARAAVARDRIAHAGGDPELVRIVAVTKGFGPEQVAAAFAAGLTDLGENYADELLAKWGTVGRAARWHFLGAVQRNKVGRLAPLVDCWQAVARVVEGEAILRHRTEVLKEPAGHGLGPTTLFVEVETTGFTGRGGCTPEKVPDRVAALRDLGCGVEGLMTVAPPGDPKLARATFDQVARLRDELGLRELSMGMSEDLEQAVAAGATMVRLGTALFGPRPQRRRL